MNKKIKQTVETSKTQFRHAVLITDDINREEVNLGKIRQDIDKDKDNAEKKPISKEKKSPIKVVTGILKYEKHQISKQIKITKTLTRSEKHKIRRVIHRVTVNPPIKYITEVTKSHECPTCPCAIKKAKIKKLQKKVLAEMATKSIQNHL